MTTETVPEFRDIVTLKRSTFWRDARNGASVLVLDSVDGPSHADLRAIYTQARLEGIEIKKGLPLIVYGTVCRIGETTTFYFEQITGKELAALDERVADAARQAPPTPETTPIPNREVLENGRIGKTLLEGIDQELR